MILHTLASILDHLAHALSNGLVQLVLTAGSIGWWGSRGKRDGTVRSIGVRRYHMAYPVTLQDSGWHAALSRRIFTRSVLSASF
jgi:hypothetical protein